jgi:hypothetical protein
VRATVDYERAESTTNMFGGNSNWRRHGNGPVVGGRRPSARRGAAAMTVEPLPGMAFPEHPVFRRRRFLTGVDAADAVTVRPRSIVLLRGDRRRPDGERAEAIA